MEENQLLYTSEDIDLNRRVNFNQNVFKMEYSPPEWLSDAESPFKWITSLETILLVHTGIPEKLLDYKNQGADYGFEKFTMLLSYLIMHINPFDHSSDSSSGDEDEPSDGESSIPEKDKTNTIVDLELEELLSLAKDALNEMVANEGDIMYTRIGPAMRHVLQAFESHWLFVKGNVGKSKEIARCIQPVTEMTLESLAGFEGIKAKFILTVYKDVRAALVALEKAMELDPCFAAWKCLAGKAIRRLRRDYKEDMPIEELDYFQKAVDLERNPKYLVFLAQAYQEMALQYLRKKTLADDQKPDTVDNMFRKSVDLFRECWCLKNDSAPILRRVGNGMLKLKGDFVDLTLGKEALLKVVELSPNSVIYHQLGTFYYKHLKDDEKALECFAKTNGFFGFSDTIRVNLIRDPEYDPHDLIESLAASAERLAKRDNIYCDVAWYYLFMKRDLDMAVKFFWKILRRDFKSFRVLEFQSYAFCVYGPLNVLKILVNEILLLNEKNQALIPEKRQDMTFMLKFLEKVLEKHPDLSELKPNPDLFERICTNAEKQISYLRKKRYGYSVWHRNETVDRQKHNKNIEENTSWRDESNTGNLLPRSDETTNRFFNNRSSGTSNRFDMNHRYTARDVNDTDIQEGMRRQYNNSRYDSTIRGSGSNRYTARDVNGTDIQEGMRRQYNNSRYDSTIRGSGSNRYTAGDVNGTDRQEGMRRQYNNNRYDTTVTDWRSENRSQK